MPLDRRIVRAIEEAVHEEGEDHPLAAKIIALVEELAAGNLKLSDRDAAARHIEVLYNEVSDQTQSEYL